MAKAVQRLDGQRRVTVPKDFAKAMGVAAGDFVEVELKAGSTKMTMTPVAVVPKAAE
jgi:bifunctional DNA-binding transcriptional regulator/antitoxin component of YhaV-PrlF toxin-antitoxin module